MNFNQNFRVKFDMTMVVSIFTLVKTPLATSGFHCVVVFHLIVL